MAMAMATTPKTVNDEREKLLLPRLVDTACIIKEDNVYDFQEDYLIAYFL